MKLLLSILSLSFLLSCGEKLFQAKAKKKDRASDRYITSKSTLNSLKLGPLRSLAVCDAINLNDRETFAILITELKNENYEIFTATKNEQLVRLFDYKFNDGLELISSTDGFVKSGGFLIHSGDSEDRYTEKVDGQQYDFIARSSFDLDNMNDKSRMLHTVNKYSVNEDKQEKLIEELVFESYTLENCYKPKS